MFLVRIIVNRRQPERKTAPTCFNFINTFEKTSVISTYSFDVLIFHHNQKLMLYHSYKLLLNIPPEAAMFRCRI